MRLIVDSGSTKTDWIAIDDSGNILFETQTLGLNPQVLSEAIVEERIINNYELYRIRNEVDSTFFYGAGCGTSRPKINGWCFKEYFSKLNNICKRRHLCCSLCNYRSWRAKYSLYFRHRSNCSLYDGQIVHQKITSLGYILWTMQVVTILVDS